MSKRAIILAGGKGTRLRPYTVVLPKPLMPIGEFPILEVVIRQLAGSGFDHITLAVNHQAELIQAFFGNGEKWGICIDYSMEDQPLGTMGPLSLINDLPDNVLVMNGDILTDLDFGEFFRLHKERKAVFSIASYRRELRTEYGVLETDDDGFLQGFKEKPVLNFDVSMGVYVVSRRARSFVPETGAFGFDQLMLALMAAEQPVTVERHLGYWLDIGRPDDYAQAVEEFDSRRSLFLKE